MFFEPNRLETWRLAEMKMTKMGKLPHFVAHHGIMRSNMVMEIPTHSCNTLCWRPHKFPPECLATSLRAIRVPQLRSKREMEMWASWVLGNQPTFIACLKKLQESMIAFAMQYTAHTHVNVHRYAYTIIYIFAQKFLGRSRGVWMTGAYTAVRWKKSNFFWRTVLATWFFPHIDYIRVLFTSIIP